MVQRTALVLETNPVITERYLNYTHDSQWRIMLKDTLNGFLEKLQQETFSLIIAEESLVPLGIINMLKSTGIPLLLSTNTKNAGTATLPRNFNRTELLTVLDRLVPPDSVKETPEQTHDDGDDAVNEILSDLEDEEDFFELSSDSVVSEASQPQYTENIKENVKENFQKNVPEESSGNLFDDEEFLSDSVEPVSDETSSPSANIPGKEGRKKDKNSLFAPPPLSVFNEKDDEIDNLVNSLSVDLTSPKPEEGVPKAETVQTEEGIPAEESVQVTENIPETETSQAEENGENVGNQETFQSNDDFDSFLFNDSTPQEFSMDDDGEPENQAAAEVPPIPSTGEEKVSGTTLNTPAEPQKNGLAADNSEIIKAEIREWLDKNARSIIKEIVLEQLASLSGKNND